MALFPTIKPLSWFALVLLLSACSHDYQLMRTEETLNQYGAAIRWSLFKRAVTFLADPSKEKLGWKELGKVEVTHYKPTFRDLFPSGNILIQTVEIHYLTGGGIVERSLTDEQRWRYDEAQERWLLETGLPKFKIQ